MKSMRERAILLACSFGSVLAAQAASADPIIFNPRIPLLTEPLPCLKEVFQAARTTTDPHTRLDVTLVSNQKNGIVQYTKGALSYDRARDVFVGKASSLFSDRTRAEGCTGSGDGFCFPKMTPFNPDAADEVQISLRHNGKTDFVLLSWGNAKGTVQMQCSDTELYGKGGAVGNSAANAFYVLSLNGYSSWRPPH